MNYAVTTKPTLAEIKAWLPADVVRKFAQVSHTKDNAEIEGHVVSALSRCEVFGRVAILPKTVVAEFRVPKSRDDLMWLTNELVDPDKIARNIALPVSPAISITEMVFLSDTRTPQTPIPASSYELDVSKRFILWKTTPPWATEFPILRVTYVAGLTDETDLELVKGAVKEVAVVIYDNKGKTDVAIPTNAGAVLRKFWHSLTYRP